MSTTKSPEAPIAATGAGLFLELLKNKTAVQHRTLESQRLLATLMSSQVTTEQYYYYLVSMQQVERVYENKIWPAIAFLFPPHLHRLASQLIGQDLSQLGYVPAANRTVQAYEIPLLNISIPFALGFMYVMEGSKLGGKVIYKHIHKTLQYSAGFGATFIADNNVDTGKNWKEFLSIFSRFAVENKMEEEVLEGANFAFTSIHEYFELNTSVYGV